MNLSYSKIRSSISTKFLQGTLKRGAWFAGSGALLLLLGGTLFPISYLKFWGAPLFFTALFLIALGLIPYRKLTQLQLKPNELHHEGSQLLYLQKGKPLFKIPLERVAKIEYVENGNQYGIGVRLKTEGEKIKILNPKFNLEAFLAESQQICGCDLFLPYFTKVTSELFIAQLESDRAS